MGVSVIPFIVCTIFWGGIGGVLPIFVPKGPNRSIIQAILILTGACCWLFWLCCYVAQLNPLIGPKFKIYPLLIMARQWDNPIQ